MLKLLKIIVSFLFTAPLGLHLLALFALALYIAKVIIFNHVPEVFDGAYEMGLLLDGALASTVASYIFYMIVVHIKYYRDTTAMAPQIHKILYDLVFECEQSLYLIARETNTHLDLDSLRLEDLNTSLKNMHPYENESPLLLIDQLGKQRSGNWTEFMSDWARRSNEAVQKALPLLRYIDSGCAKHVAAIHSSLFFGNYLGGRNIRISASELTASRQIIFDFCLGSVLN